MVNTFKFSRCVRRCLVLFPLFFAILVVKFHQELEDTTSYQDMMKQPMNLIFMLPLQGVGSPAFWWELVVITSGDAVLLASQPSTNVVGCCLACTLLASTLCLTPNLSVPDHCFDASAINKMILMNFSSDVGLSCVTLSLN